MNGLRAGMREAVKATKTPKSLKRSQRIVAVVGASQSLI